MRLILIAIVMLSLPACSERDLRQAYDVINQSAAEAPLTNQEIVAALKDALSSGITRGAATASRKDGYFGDPRLKIEFPEDVIKVENTMRRIGLGNEIDRFVKQLNRSAERAATAASVRAITSMTIYDAIEILNGAPDAATQYLMRTTGDELRAQFLPIVRDTLDQTSATRYYSDIVQQYNSLPLVSDVNPDLDQYATDKAVAGLFVLIAEEEARAHYPFAAARVRQSGLALAQR
jgi:hypothetical protein